MASPTRGANRGGGAGASVTELILASGSPRRRALLQTAGWPARVLIPEVDELQATGEAAEAYVLRLAESKARAVLPRVDPTAVILAADTCVLLDGEVMGKPQDEADARAMLGRLQGREHAVLTGVCVLSGERAITAVERTRVWFAPLSAVAIAAYVGSGEALDKAGAYGIQGRAAPYIPRIEGCYFNVVGLPLATVRRLLQGVGYSVP